MYIYIYICIYIYIYIYNQYPLLENSANPSGSGIAVLYVNSLKSSANTIIFLFYCNRVGKIPGYPGKPQTHLGFIGLLGLFGFNIFSGFY